MVSELVSICTSCYNHAQYLQDFIDSIIDQSYDNIELLLIDDCSVDFSRDIIRKNIERLNKRFVRVVYIENKENKGLIKNLNTLLTKANGRYIKLFASDDIMKVDCISILVDYMNKNPQMDMVYSTYKLTIDNNFSLGNKDNKANRIKLEKLPAYNQDKMFEKLLEGCFILAPSVLLRKRSMQRIGKFDVHAVYEDYEYWVRMSVYGKIGHIDEPVVYYRNSINSWTHINGKEKKFLDYYHAQFYIIAKYKKLINPKDLDRILICKYKKLKILAKENKLYKYFVIFLIKEIRRTLKRCILQFY